jgi:hypothetical protein
MVWRTSWDEFTISGIGWGLVKINRNAFFEKRLFYLGDGEDP